MKTPLLALAVTISLTSVAAADPWKDESGKGRWRAERGEFRDHYARI